MIRHRYRGALKTVALLILTFHIRTLSAQDSGVIDFSDQAPPPSEEQRKQAAAWSKRVEHIVSLLDRLGPSIRASFRLRKAVVSTEAIPPDMLDKVANGQSRWEESRRKLFVKQVETNRWAIDSDALTPYVKDTLKFANALESASRLWRESDEELVVRGYDGSVLLQEVDSFIDEQATWFDELVAENAILNGELGRWPYNTAPPTKIPCELINVYSRDFKCLPATSVGQLHDTRWLFGDTIDLADFCRGAGLFVRRTLIVGYMGQVESFRGRRSGRLVRVGPSPITGLVGAAIDHPRTGNSLGAKCK